MGWIALGILGTAALVLTGFLAGYIASGSSASASGIIGDNPTTCDDFCKAWQGARLDTCAAVNALASAQAFADTLAKAAGAAALAAAAAAAVAFAGVDPFPWPDAGGCFHHRSSHGIHRRNGSGGRWRCRSPERERTGVCQGG
jgi:hypothetical protein